MKGRLSNFLAELRNRKVYTTGVAYIVVAWALLQVADVVLPIYDAPEWMLRTFTTLLFLGFPLAVVLAWFFDITLSGIRKAPAARFAQPSIAVLPFRNLGPDKDRGLFAEALSDGIVAGLTKAHNLVVFSAAATRDMTSEQSAGETGRALGAMYVLGGSVWKEDGQLRVTATLSDSRHGTTLWSQNYDRSLNAESVFGVQDAIQQQIVGAIASRHGVINTKLSDLAGERPTQSLDAYELFARALAYDRYISEENHLMAREALEEAVSLDPDFAEAWAHLSWIYTDEVCWGFNPLPDSMERALEAAQKGVRLGQENHHNHWLLARVHYFMANREEFEAEVERSLELNSNDGTTLGLLGLYICWSGDWERGLSMLQRSKELNPNYPAYYHLVTGSAELAAGNLEAALREMLRANLRDWPLNAIFLSATYALLDRTADARSQLDQYRKIRPGATLDSTRAELEGTFPFQPAMVNLLIDGLRQAGLGHNP